MTSSHSGMSVAIQKRRKPRTASRYNVVMMEKLQKALRADPSADLSVALPSDYASRRDGFILEEAEYQRFLESEQAAQKAPDQTLEVAVDQGSNVTPQDAFPQATVTQVVFDLSDEAKAALRLDSWSGETLTEALQSMLRRCTLLCSPDLSTHILRCDTGLVVKCFVPDDAANGKDFTQYTSIRYLESHMPEIPAPRAHGLLTSGRKAYMMMTYIPGETLEATWPRLTSQQKNELRDDLGRILEQMRSYVDDSNTMLGGVGGEGCKDTRRHTAISSKPCRSSAAFHDFVYGAPTCASPMWIRSVRSWMPAIPETPIVFTHGDLRPANIHVINDDGRYRISALLDWEMSGFYPAWWEACKITNCMSTVDTWDWYLYLPACVSPAKYLHHWLFDRFWDPYLVGRSGLVSTG